MAVLAISWLKNAVWRWGKKWIYRGEKKIYRRSRLKFSGERSKKKLATRFVALRGKNFRPMEFVQTPPFRSCQNSKFALGGSKGYPPQPLSTRGGAKRPPQHTTRPQAVVVRLSGGAGMCGDGAWAWRNLATASLSTCLPSGPAGRSCAPQPLTADARLLTIEWLLPLDCIALLIFNLLCVFSTLLFTYLVHKLHFQVVIVPQDINSVLWSWD